VESGHSRRAEVTIGPQERETRRFGEKSEVERGARDRYTQLAGMPGEKVLSMTLLHFQFHSEEKLLAHKFV
jgi:hypothetical protein